MMGMLALAIVAFMAWLGYDDHEKTQRVKALTAEVRELTTGRAAFDLQQRCAAQAEKQFKTTGDGKEPLAGFENHYNLALGKCFMRVSSYTTAGLAQYVADAAEGATYASYYFLPDETKKDREGAPFACFVQPPNGSRKYCHSSEEFDVLVKPFMER